VNSLWQQSLSLLPRAFKKAWWWLLFSMILEEAFGVWIKDLSRGDERLYVIGGMFTLLLQLILGAFGIIIINQIIFDIRSGRESNVVEDLKKNLKFVFIESTRALLPVLLKSLLLIIPGVIEGIRLYFVPYIAQFDEEYKRGHVDALERSRALIRGRFWMVTGVLIITLILSMVPRLYLETIEFSNRPGFYALVFFTCMVLELFGDIALFMTYIRLEESSGNKVSLS